LSDTDAKTFEGFCRNFIKLVNKHEIDSFSKYGLQEFVTINKTRKTYNVEGAVICLDDVEGLGKYIEIEALNPKSITYLTEYCKKINLTNLEIGYVELFLRANHFNIYKQG